METTVAQCRYLLSLAEPILIGLDDSHRALEPQPGTKTAGWLVGHLAVSGDFARRLCGRTPLCPPNWRPAFNPGSNPSPRPDDYPAMTSLHQAFREVYADLCAAALEADPHALASVNPFTPTRIAFRTTGEFLAYLLTGHLAYHLGQLVGRRAAAGLGRLHRPDTLAA
jgi:hypothetical protein